MKGPQRFRSAPQGTGANIVQQKLERAFYLLQQGNLAEAKLLCEDVLKNNRTNFNALHLLGLICYKAASYVEAEKILSKAVRVNPDVAFVHSSYGITLKELGRCDEAVASFDRAIALKPDFAEAYLNRGNAQQDLKLFNESLASYDRAIALNPNFSEAHSNRGNTLKELKRFDEALASLDRAIALQPDLAQAHYNRGLSLQELDRSDEALASYDRAIALKPDFAEAHLNRGLALQELKRFEDALVSYDRAIAFDENFAEMHSNRGLALQELKHFEEALASFDRAIALKPDFAEAHSNRGNTLKDLGRFDEALASYDRAIAFSPGLAAAHSNRGWTLHQLKRFEAAIESYDKAIGLKPDYANAYWNKSMALLLNGDFQNGWQLYEWRWNRDKFLSQKRHFEQPLWLGKESLKERTILLHPEQGFGDTIQFCRYAGIVEALGAKVILSVPQPLQRLLKRSNPTLQVVTQIDEPTVFDFHCPLASLPLAFGTTLETIPSQRQYLRADEELRLAWAARLPPNAKPNIGIVWSGNPAFVDDHNRSMELQQFLPIIGPDANWVCLQKEMRERDVIALRQHDRIAFFGDDLTDFDETAALIDRMDLVITTDTGVAHLAGAMGKPVWILLSANADWRWLLERDDCPWYPSARLFRQQRIGQWAGVIDRVKNELRSVIG